MVTVTAVVANPTLSEQKSNSSTQYVFFGPWYAHDVDVRICSRFFHNKGAVTGVFLIIGLAAATICLWIFFFCRKRRGRRQIEHDIAISQSLAAAGYNRAPIDDEDFGPGMRQRFGSLSSHPTIGTPITDEERAADAGPGAVNLYDPYADYGRPIGGSGYIPARADSPSQHSRDRTADDTYSSGASRRTGSMHISQHGSGSGDPLLASMALPPHAIPQPFTLTNPTVPLRNPKRKGGQEGQPSEEAGGSSSYEPPPPVYRAAGGRDQKSAASG